MNIHFEIAKDCLSVTKLCVFLKISFIWALDNGKGDLNVKIGEIRLYNIDNTIQIPIN